jgi:hypothetical protein
MTTRIDRAERIKGNTYRFHIGPDGNCSAVVEAFNIKLRCVDILPKGTHVDVGPLSMEEAGILVQEINSARLF